MMRRLLPAIVALGLLGCGRQQVTPAAPSPTPATPPTQTGCGRTSTGLVPLFDMGARTYNGEPGGLYPGRSNARPDGHDTAGLERARAIGPLSSDGIPDPRGRYAFVSIGMSNTTQEFSAFKGPSDADISRDPALVVVDGAQGGQTALLWSSPGCACWGVLDERLARAGIAAKQVAVAWIKLADAGPSSGWPQYARQLRDETATIVRLLKTRFPNLQLAYLSSRIYAGYATTALNPEPYAYESAFSVRWLIEDQLRGEPSLNFDASRGAVAAPWLAWGPYLWADGLTPRSDGLTWTCAELQQDGTHPSTIGQRKVADLLLTFVRTDTTAREWYLAGPF
ncbi:MAG: hypothetical protein IMZ55_05885 [Acidobacteria bacterium]|nr:hypothetical protein [Acidobacteriota bacterium]